MDARSQHDRFRSLVKPLVEYRHKWDPSFAQQDWMTKCYDSRDVFETFFPDRSACETILNELETDMRNNADDIIAEASRLRREGLSYLDIERLRYEFPRIEEDQGFIRRETVGIFSPRE